ncbi:hypothetical protein BLOT_001526 [Blomia tropicalis]|nr:hypothetical protein BLOT_001526 [Blomia tropicalis]
MIQSIDQLMPVHTCDLYKLYILKVMSSCHNYVAQLLNFKHSMYFYYINYSNKKFEFLHPIEFKLYHSLLS